LQFGAEIYGHAGLEADLEVQELAMDCLQAAGVADPVLDLGDARIVEGVLQGLAVEGERLDDLISALSSKDASAVHALSNGFPDDVRRALQGLLSLYGSEEVIDLARRDLPNRPLITRALDDLSWLRIHLQAVYPRLKVGFDLSDTIGYAYYSGPRFAAYDAKSSDALLRGGRYDEVGAVFGRNRPAVGFSLDVKTLAESASARPPRAAVRAPWGEDAALREAIRQLRAHGETVVCVLPGHEHEGEEFACDRELIAEGDRWSVRPL
jgi:ATP phosphoribosyltransferase regulatory subunit